MIFQCCCIAFCVGLGKPDARLILSSWWFIFSFYLEAFSLSWKADSFLRLCGSWFLWVTFPRCPHALSVCRFVLFSVSWKFPWIIVWVLTSTACLSSFSGARTTEYMSSFGCFLFPCFFSWPFNFFSLSHFYSLVFLPFFFASYYIFIQVFSPLSTLRFILISEILLSFFLISFLCQINSHFFLVFSPFSC